MEGSIQIFFVGWGQFSDLQKSSQNPQNHNLNCFIRRNNVFSVHLSHSGAIPDLSDRNLRVGQIDPPPQTSPNFGTQNLIYIYREISCRFASYRGQARTRFDRLEIVSTTGYMQNDFVFRNSLSPLSGLWGINLTPLTISYGKVRNGPQMVVTDGKQVITTNKIV